MSYRCTVVTNDDNHHHHHVLVDIIRKNNHASSDDKMDIHHFHPEITRKPTRKPFPTLERLADRHTPIHTSLSLCLIIPHRASLEETPTQPRRCPAVEVLLENERSPVSSTSSSSPREREEWGRARSLRTSLWPSPRPRTRPGTRHYQEKVSRTRGKRGQDRE